MGVTSLLSLPRTVKMWPRCYWPRVSLLLTAEGTGRRRRDDSLHYVHSTGIRITMNKGRTYKSERE